MRIRSIKPEFWRSDDIDALDWEARLVFIGLWSYVDDNGVGIWKVSNIAADLFAHDLSVDPIETLSRLKTALDALVSQSLVEVYEVDGREYVHITNWLRHQRVNNPNKPRFPLPTSVNADEQGELLSVSINPIETLGTGTGEQGNRGTGEQSSGRKRPSVRLPDDWVPTADHRARAEAKGVDVDVLAEEMRNWAASKDERKANWNAAFTNWIIRANKTASNALKSRAPSGRLWQE